MTPEIVKARPKPPPHNYRGLRDHLRSLRVGEEFLWMGNFRSPYRQAEACGVKVSVKRNRERSHKGWWVRRVQ